MDWGGSTGHSLYGVLNFAFDLQSIDEGHTGWCEREQLVLMRPQRSRCLSSGGLPDLAKRFPGPGLRRLREFAESVRELAHPKQREN